MNNDEACAVEMSIYRPAIGSIWSNIQNGLVGEETRAFNRGVLGGMKFVMDSSGLQKEIEFLFELSCTLESL